MPSTIIVIDHKQNPHKPKFNVRAKLIEGNMEVFVLASEFKSLTDPKERESFILAKQIWELDAGVEEIKVSNYFVIVSINEAFSCNDVHKPIEEIISAYVSRRKLLGEVNKSAA